MTPYVPMIAYVMIGFTIASLLAKFYPEYFDNSNKSEPPGELVFVICTAIWPLIALYHTFKLPLRALSWYVKKLTDRS